MRSSSSTRPSRPGPASSSGWKPASAPPAPPCSPPPWPGAALRLTTGNAVWSGLGDGHGALRSRTTDAHCTGRGRGRATRPRTTRLLLPDENGSVSAAQTAAAAGTASATGAAVAG
ncbi:hypothetical protein ACFWOG_12475 [Kitasatospora sp. NPDC058406]|uniref:hypothetical protein n=1 Tax=Kitasatospora sp. NPDC058406 TaxID=3346483 RepID=UPI003669B6D6